jgi:glycosyltransferase involved in cell wall biosynthesis
LNKRKKLIIVSHVLNRSGAPTSLLNIVKQLSESYDIYVLAIAGGELEGEYNKYSKKVFIPLNKYTFPFNKLNKFFAIIKFIVKINPNFILINTSVNNMTLVATWILRKKFLVYVRESENMLNFKHKKHLLKLATHIIAVSNETKKWISKYVDKSNISVVYNGIDFNSTTIKNSVEHNKEVKTKYMIAIIGYMCQRKGIDFFLELILLLSKQNKEIEFMIIGDFENNTEKEFFLESLEINNLENIVSITGIVENVYKYISISDIVVMMSREEALPRTVMEAAFMKKPVVAFDTAGTKEMLPTTEFVVKQYDLNQFSNKVLNIIINNRFKELGDSNYKYLEQNFDLNTQIKKIENIIKKYEE